MSFFVISNDLSARAQGLDIIRELNKYNNEFLRYGLAVHGDRICIYSSNNCAFVDEYMSLHGYAFSRDRLFHGKAGSGQLSHLWEAIDEAEGVFVLLRAGREARSLRVRPDVLGQYPVFYYQAGQDFLVSDNPEMVARVLRHIGLGGEPNPLQVALNVTYGSGFGTGSSYRGVRLLPSRNEIVWDEDGGFRLREIVSRNALLEKHHGSYDDAVRTVAGRLSARCRTIANEIDAHWHTVVDLSGGVDSRMTLAGLLRSESATRFSYFSYGDFPTQPDRHVCDMLIQKYGLGPGIHIGQNTSATYSTSAQITQGAARYFGLKPTNFADYGTVEISEYCRLTGYCGEHTRAWGPSLLQKDLVLEPAGEVAARLMVFCNLSESMLTETGLSAVRDALANYFAGLIDEVGNKMLNQFTYIENRSRFHFGLASAVANKVRVSLDPLIDRQVISASTYLSFWQQKTNRLAYDIIATLGGKELAQHPFAEFVWNKGIGIGGYDDYAANALSVDASTPPQCREAVGMGVAEVKPTVGRVETEFDRSEFSSLPDGERRTLRPSVERGMLLYLAEKIHGNDPVWDLVDRKHMIAAAMVDGPHSKLKETNISRLAASLSYYSGEAQAAPLTASVSAKKLLDAMAP